MDVSTIAEGRRLEAEAENTREKFSDTLACEALDGFIDALSKWSQFLRSHARELLAAAEQREAILAIARQHAHPGVNPGAHGLASQILRIAVERPERSE